MDKATLLAEVITQVRELKKKVVEASQGFLIPMDADEVRVESCNIDGAEDGAVSYRASLCCDDRPQLFSELKQAIDGLQLEMVKVETSTLGNRVKNEFVYTCCRGDHINTEECQSMASHVHQTLTSLLEKAATLPAECSPKSTTVLPSKRRRAPALFDTSSSSSGKPRRCCDD